MIKFILIVLISGLFSCNLYAQEYLPDSSIIKSNSIKTIESIILKFDEFEFYRDKFHSNIFVPLDGDNSTVQLRTEMIIRESIKNELSKTDNDLYFLSPLYNKHIEDSKFNPVRYVLGMAQLGAVGYLAYRHIKKYGFID